MEHNVARKTGWRLPNQMHTVLQIARITVGYGVLREKNRLHLK